MKYEYLIIIDITHNIYLLNQNLFIVIIQNKYENSILKVYMIYEHKNRYIILVFLLILSK